MTEINTDHELLVLRTEPTEQGAPTPRSIEAAENDGGVLHRYGPHVEIRRTQPLEIGGTPFTPSPKPRAPLGTLSFAEELGIGAFTLRRSPAYRTAKANRPRDGEAWDMRGCAPKVNDTPTDEALITSMVAAPQADDMTRGSELSPGAAMLVGSVAVGIIIVNGPTVATQFSESERVKVVAEVQAGLTWLGNQEPSAGINWNYEIHNVSIPTATDATAVDDESRWRNPAMGRLGHTENWQGVIDYVNAMRARLRTRWAYCVFFVKGYPLWHFAYASAPRIVMDYANAGWGPDNIDRVFAHETGHIFSCPDEYSAASCICTSTHGIYDEPNANCATCAPGGGIACLMKANDWAMCSHTRRHLGWGLTTARVPQGAPIHAVSRSRDKLDIFFTDQDGRVMSAAWEPSMPVWWEGFWHINGGMAMAGAPVTAAVRGPNKLDIFVVGADNHVYTAAWRTDSGGWQGWWRIGDIRVPHRTPVHAVSRSADKLDIFVTDVSGRVMTAAWEPGFTDGWHGWWHINGGMGAPGAPVTAVVRSADKLDIFVVGADGGAYTAAWQPNSNNWQGWWRIGNARFPAQAEINAVSRSRDKLDIFATANGGETLTAAWEPGFTDGWHGWWHIRDGRARPGAPIHVVSRSTDKLDIFVTGTDGFIYTAAWEPSFTDWWHGWWRLNGGRTTLGGAVTAVSRAPDKLDAFVVGGDSRIYTAAWEPTFTDWWHGWWPMGS
jgi:hypothetical protein